jgi:hypothetical protein
MINCTMINCNCLQLIFYWIRWKCICLIIGISWSSKCVMLSLQNNTFSSSLALYNSLLYKVPQALLMSSKSFFALPMVDLARSTYINKFAQSGILLYLRMLAKCHYTTRKRDFLEGQTWLKCPHSPRGCSFWLKA